MNPAQARTATRTIGSQSPSAPEETPVAWLATSPTADEPEGLAPPALGPLPLPAGAPPPPEELSSPLPSPVGFEPLPLPSPAPLSLPPPLLLPPPFWVF